MLLASPPTYRSVGRVNLGTHYDTIEVPFEA